MKFLTTCFSFLLLALLVTSCQSGPDETLGDPPPPPPPPPGTADTTQLKMVVGVDTSFASGLDTSEKYILQYDASKRLVLVDNYEYEPGTPGVQFHHYEKRFYNGTDTLPYKAIYFYDDAPTADDVDTVFFTYQNSVIVKDSDIYVSVGNPARDITVTKYQQLAAGKFNANIYRVLNGPDLELADSLVSVQTRTNGNLVSQADIVYPAAIDGTWNFTRQYDNHPSPLQRLSLPFPILNYGLNVGVYSFLQTAKSVNNETRVTHLVGGQPDFDDISTYQYRADGYPVIVRANEVGQTLKGYFIYAN